jgi:hypothetical protein
MFSVFPAQIASNCESQCMSKCSVWFKKGEKQLITFVFERTGWNAEFLVIQLWCLFMCMTEDKKQRKYIFLLTYDEFITLVYTEQFGEQRSFSELLEGNN